MLRRVMLLILAAGALVAPAQASADPARAALPPIRHVFVVVLENENYDASFGHPSDRAAYLTRRLPALGQLLPNYYGIAHNSLANYVAMISGQGPNLVTQADCPLFMNVVPGLPAGDGQVFGQGCVYPKPVRTIADQLDKSGLRWRAYLEDMGNGGAGQAKTCRHPALGSRDSTQSARNGDQYAARHNPFVYFHSIIDDQARCDGADVPLDRLPADLRAPDTTRNYSFIVPNLCNTGHDGGGTKRCVDGQPGGLESASSWLATWIPRILASPAYKRDGLLLVTFDEAEGTAGAEGDASACCGEIAGPNTLNPGGQVIGRGGGRTGTVAISRYIRPGTVNPTPYNHYSLLRSSEDLFALPHLGFAASPGLKAFGNDVYNAPRAVCAPRPLPKPVKGRYARGAVLASARLVRRPGNRRTLLLYARRDARLAVRVTTTRGRHGRSVGPRIVAGCRAYRIALPFAHGLVSVRAAVGTGSERRNLRY